MSVETSKFSFVKSCGASGEPTLAPGDDRARSALDKIAQGREVMVTIKVARRPRQHRAFFAVLAVLVDSGVFETLDVALVAVKVAAGEVDSFIEGSTGQVFYTVRSISFESMDQVRFGELFETTLNIVCNRWLVGTNIEDLRNRVIEIVEDKRLQTLGKRVRRAA